MTLRQSGAYPPPRSAPHFISGASASCPEALGSECIHSESFKTSLERQQVWLSQYEAGNKRSGGPLSDLISWTWVFAAVLRATK